MLGGLGLVLADAVADEIDHVQARHALLLQVVDRVRILLAENGDQHVGTCHFLLAVGSGLDVHDRALDHALEAERGLGIDLVGPRHHRRVIRDEVLKAGAQVLDIGRAGAQDFSCRGIVEQCQQQMLHGNELVACLPGFNESHVQAHFQFLRNHASSITHCRGCPACRACVDTSSTLVAAISLV
ncbi:hypothetical protein D3C81_1662050 [compost metagenome]